MHVTEYVGGTGTGATGAPGEPCGRRYATGVTGCPDPGMSPGRRPKLQIGRESAPLVPGARRRKLPAAVGSETTRIEEPEMECGPLDPSHRKWLPRDVIQRGQTDE